MAHALEPPVYPNSQMTYSWESGSSDKDWDRRYYHTTDEVGQVIAFYDRELPEFEKSVSEGTISYQKCDESALAKRLARFMYGKRLL